MEEGVKIIKNVDKLGNNKKKCIDWKVIVRDIKLVYPGRFWVSGRS